MPSPTKLDALIAQFGKYLAPPTRAPYLPAAAAAGVGAGAALAPQDADAALLSHWSRIKGLTETDPSRYGTGLRGAERTRKINDPEYWQDRTYFGMDGGYEPEPGLGPVRYEADVPDERIYDFAADPAGLKAGLKEKGSTRATEYEKAIKDAGYAGYFTDTPGMGKVAAMFEKVPVRQMTPAVAGAAAVGGLLGTEEAEAAPFGTLARELGTATQGAWHGSPHQFEADRLLGSKAYTGEGNQAYAAGRYVSLDEGVGRNYRDALGGGQGSLYQVEIPANDQLLDWDQPLGAQPAAIADRVQDVYSEMLVAATKGISLADVQRMEPERLAALKARLGQQRVGSATGEELYDAISQQLGSKEAASEYLRSKGILGTTYIGQESRQRNAVLFGDEATNVYSKDGEAFPPDGPLPVPEVEELDLDALPGLLSGTPSAAPDGAELLQRQGARQAQQAEAVGRYKAATAGGLLGTAGLLAGGQASAAEPPEIQALQADAARRAAEADAAREARRQERAGGVADVATRAVDQALQSSPGVQQAASNPGVQLAAEFTGLPSVYRAAKDYAAGVRPAAGDVADIALSAIPLVPFARAARAADKTGDILRPGAEGYRNPNPSSLNQKRRPNEPKVNIPRLRVANAGRPKGSIVGLPEGMEQTEESIEKLADEYAGRVMTGIENGVEPGYFYAEGNRDLRQWTGGDPYDVARISGQLAATSPQAPVDTNLLWAVRGNEQQAMGYPVTTGKSPGQVRKDYQKVEESLARQRAAGVTKPSVEVGGPKTKPFGQYMNDETALAPNDRWEMFGIGYPRNANFSPQERQMAHYIRQRAQEKLAQRGVNLDLDHIQEIHWQAVRGPATNTPMVPGAGDTFQHSADPLRVQHNWEVAPGTHAQHMPEYYDKDQAGQSAIGARLNRHLIDDNGRDRLVAATGGGLQPQPFRVTRGSFEGFPTEGYKSTSMAPVDKGRAPAGGMEQATRERLDATEGARALALGQTAGSASVRRDMPSELANEVQFGLTEDLTPEDVDRLQGALDRVFGPGKVFPEMVPGGVALAHWEDPLRLRVAEGEFNQYGRNVKFKRPGAKNEAGSVQIELRSKAAGERLRKAYGKDNVKINAKTNVATVIGTRPDWDRALGQGGYQEIADALGAKYNRAGTRTQMRDSAFVPLRWEKGQATADFLATLKAPRQREMFDSPEVRDIMGGLAKEYRAIEADGVATPNPKLVSVLETWATKGIAGVEEMVRKGLAPAAALGTAIAMYNQQGAGSSPQPAEGI